MRSSGYCPYRPVRCVRRFVGTDDGLSLIEATIIVMVLAIMAAVTAPAVDGYLSDARQARARRDVSGIAQAIARFMHDTGEDFFLIDGNGASATVAPLHTSANLVKLLVSDGDIPAKGVTRSGGATPDWDSPRNEGGAAPDDVQSLAEHLIRNAPNNLTANAYRTAANMTDAPSRDFDPSSGATFNSEFAWRGPYLSGPVDPDPWGHRYGVNVEFLAKLAGTPGSAPGGNVNDVFVLSAGPDGETDTRFDVDGVVPGDDDILVVVQGGTR